MRWLEPWSSAENLDEKIAQGLVRQLAIEVPPGHQMFELPVRLIGRGDDDDVLFEILDGSGRVAEVHLTWSKSREHLPWPVSVLYPSLGEWVANRMLPEHQEWRS